MELRRCSHTHFIQAIRGGLVIKVHNTNSHGKPALSFKSLKDVYESIDAKTLRKPPTVNLRNTEAGLPMVERTLCDIKTETDEIDPHSYGSDNDLDDNTTLGQLKDKFLRKKRKFNHSDENLNLADPDENPVIDQSHLNLPMVDRILREMKSEKDEYASYPKSCLDSDSDDDTTLKQLKERLHEKKQKIGGGGDEKHYMLVYSNESSVEDEYDLNEPIINLRSKCPRRSKAKRKCTKGSVVFSSTTALNVICDLNLVSEGPQQVGNNLAPVIHVKVEDDDANELETPRGTSFPGDSSFCINEVPCPGGEVSNGVEFEKTLFTADECEKCVTNQISYDHLEETEPISVLVPSEGMNDMFLETPELSCHEVLEEISEQSSSSGLQDLDMTTNCTIGCTGLRDELSMIQSEDNIKAGLPHEHDNSVSSTDKNSSSSQDSFTSLKTNDSSGTMMIPNEEHRVTHTLDDIIENGLNCITNINDELLKTEEGQASACSITKAERQSSPKNQSLAYADPITTEPCRPPERLFSTRKAISPSSQEQLCSAMNSVELCNDIDHYKRKRQLCEGETGKKPFAIIDMQHAKIAVNHGAQGKVTQRKVNISSTRIKKKSRNAKINLEGPRLSHVLANISTECTSIQGCSQSAIAFSERQMQDMESLAFKLMDELESMKCMVEQKLLFEAYRNVSLKSDADEVKSAISSASKMEETARKWISTMARDCKRFCKIMKMTPNNSTSSKDAVPREKRKIVFADEAGGELCHVKFFEAGATPPVPDDVKQ
ncbi:hypothetical protein OROGR_026328 [Orobanche gracilis]